MLNVVLMKPSKHIFFVKTHENKKKKDKGDNSYRPGKVSRQMEQKSFLRDKEAQSQSATREIESQHDYTTD